jgi:hypothetical protein
VTVPRTRRRPSFGPVFRLSAALLRAPLLYSESGAEKGQPRSRNGALALVFNSIKSLKVYARGLDPKGLS